MLEMVQHIVEKGSQGVIRVPKVLELVLHIVEKGSQGVKKGSQGVRTEPPYC